jgi:hypothetical protein
VLPEDKDNDEGFADDLSATWDAMEAGEDRSSILEQEPVGESPEATASHLRDALGRFTRKIDEALGPEEQAEPSSSVSAPQHWSQADQEAFNALPAELKPLYLEKAKLLESGWNRKFEEIAGERKAYESLFGPNDVQQLEEAGLTKPQYISRLVSVARQLEADPENTIRFLAEQYGVDLGGDMYADAGMAERQAAERQVAEQRLAREWFAFQQEFRVPDSLRQPMGIYLALNPQKPGETERQALVRAFEQSKWSDPHIRTSILEAEVQSRTAESRRKADLAKAKAVGRTVTSKTMPGMNSHVPGNSWREELERNWDRANT